MKLKYLVAITIAVAFAAFINPTPAHATTSYPTDPYHENGNIWGVLYAHRSGSISSVACNSGEAKLLSVKTFGFDDSVTNSVFRAGVSDWHAANCSPIGLAAGNDSMVYQHQAKGAGSSLATRLAAYRDGALDWERTTNACQYDTGTELMHYGVAKQFHPTTGPDSTLYFLSINENTNCGAGIKTDRLHAVNAQTGQDKAGFTAPVLNNVTNPGTPLLQTPQIYPYADGVAVLYGQTVRFFATNGEENVAKARPLPMAEGQAVAKAVRGGDYLYFQMTFDSAPTPKPNEPGATCNLSTEYLRLKLSDASLERIANDDCQYRLNVLAATPDNGAVILAGDSTYSGTGYKDVLLKYDKGGAIDYVVPVGNVGADYGPAVTHSFPQVDDAGNVYLASTAYETTGDQDLQLVVRQISAAGVATIVYTGDDAGTTSKDWFKLLTEDESLRLSKGNIFLGFCRLPTNAGCSSITDNKLARITDASVGHAWPYTDGATTTGLNTDTDGDGLALWQEAGQGTEDVGAETKDKDWDGISDYVESVYSTTRISNFCGVSAQNSLLNCTFPNPIKKDIYIEIDWMDSGTVSTQPTPNQLVQIIDVFKEKGITVHIDMGGYEGPDDTDVLPGHEIGDYGGGNAVPYFGTVPFKADDGSRDLRTYKVGDAALGLEAQFDKSSRYYIWRYMLIANFINSSGAYGAANVSDDEAIISYGSVFANSLSSEEFDALLPKVIAHELGHSLCLTSGVPNIPGLMYPGHYNKCIFSKIDKTDAQENPDKYESIMHYTHLSNNALTLSDINYSDGHDLLDAELDDNNDWEAVVSSVKDFAVPDKAYNYYLNGYTCYLECE